MTLTKMTPGGAIPMTKDEEAAFLAEQAATRTGIEVQDAKALAATLLAASDLTILRCYEHGVVVPLEWAEYRATLRVIRDSGTGDFPAMPDYPAGT